MIPICRYIFGQEIVSICELVVKDDLFQLVEVFALDFGAYSWIHSRYMCTYCPHTHLSCTVLKLYLMARHGEPDIVCIYLFIYAFCTAVFLNNHKLSSSNITEFFKLKNVN